MADLPSTTRSAEKAEIKQTEQLEELIKCQKDATWKTNIIIYMTAVILILTALNTDLMGIITVYQFFWGK